jgi:hypothetical protein
MSACDIIMNERGLSGSVLLDLKQKYNQHLQGRWYLGKLAGNGIPGKISSLLPLVVQFQFLAKLVMLEIG